MRRICVDCGIEKDLEQFVKGTGNLYRYKCKDCKNEKRRTGLPNTGKFKKGEKSIGVTFKQGHTPWYKLKGVDAPAKGTGKKESRFNSAKYLEWKKLVLDRDGNKCVKCQSRNLLAAHHIKNWADHTELRFDVDNGMTLCVVCHAKEEGFQKGHVSEMTKEVREKISSSHIGMKRSEEAKKKMSLARMGKSPSNKGKSTDIETRKKISESKKGKPCINGFKKQHTPWNKGIKGNIG